MQGCNLSADSVAGLAGTHSFPLSFFNPGANALNPRGSGTESPPKG
jgi:hypothetical protein